MKIKKVVFHPDKKNFNIEEGEIGELKNGYVRIRTQYVGVCGSDKGIVLGKRDIKNPLVIGHEVSGIVALGNGKDAQGKSIMEGDIVTILPNYPCGKCNDCLVGNYNTCKNKEIVGVNVDGVMQEYFDAPLDYTFKINKSVDLRIPAIIEPTAVVVRALSKFQNKNYPLIIIGGGSTGSLAAITAEKMGFHNITVVEIVEEKVKKLLQFGFNAVTVEKFKDNNNFNNNRVNVLDTVGDGEGFESVKLWENLLSIVPAGSKVVMTGLGSTTVSLNLNNLVRREINLEGSIIYLKKDFKKAIEIVTKNEKDYLNVIGYIGNPNNINDWYFKEAIYGGHLKVLIDFTNF